MEDFIEATNKLFWVLASIAFELALLSFPLTLAWNIVVPHLTGLPSINILQAMALAFLLYFVVPNSLRQVSDADRSEKPKLSKD